MFMVKLSSFFLRRDVIVIDRTLVAKTFLSRLFYAMSLAGRLVCC